MNDPLPMGTVERVGNLLRDRQRVAHRDRSAVQAIGQRLAFHELQHERRNALDVLQPVDGTDMRMIEGSERSRLAAEPRQPLGVGGEDRRQHLDGDIAAKPVVVGAIDLAHPTSSSEREHLIAAEPPAGEGRASLLVELRRGGPAEEVDEAPGRHGLIEQRLHFAAQQVVARAGFSKEPRTVGFGPRARGMIQLLNPLPACRRHFMHHSTLHRLRASTRA